MTLQDLTFLRNIYLTKEKDPVLSNEIIRKFINHLWYLSESMKRVIVTKKHIQQFIECDISDFVTSNTMKFFTRFDISTEFLEHDPAT